MKTLEFAKEYVQQGYSVIPLKPSTLPESLVNKIYNTLLVKTGGSWGLHFYLQYDLDDFPDELNLSTNRKVLHKNGERNEIAVKADGSYVIAPPSMSSSGNQYVTSVDLRLVFVNSLLGLIRKLVTRM